MLVHSTPAKSTNMRAALSKVLHDLGIFGKITDTRVHGNIGRYRYEMSGFKKVSRAIVLAPDIARCLGVLDARVVALAGGLIEIALTTAPYLASAGGNATLRPQ